MYNNMYLMNNKIIFIKNVVNNNRNLQPFKFLLSGRFLNKLFNYLNIFYNKNMFNEPKSLFLVFKIITFI